MVLSSHATRWLVALVLAPVLLWVIAVGPSQVLILIIVLAGLAGWWEYAEMYLKGAGYPYMALGLAGWVALALLTFYFGPPGQILGLVAAAGLVAIYSLWQFGRRSDQVEVIGRLAWGHLYISLHLSFLINIFALSHGRQWVMFILIVTFLGDTAAFYVGRTLGRRPLWPAISPKKTMEGLAGNVLGCGLVAAAFTALALPVPWWSAGLLGLFLGVWGTMGDLFESMLKRTAGVKDSGRILLGHGGLLDRVDALLFNLPIIYLFTLILGER